MELRRRKWTDPDTFILNGFTMDASIKANLSPPLSPGTSRNPSMFLLELFYNDVTLELFVITDFRKKFLEGMVDAFHDVYLPGLF